MNYLSVFATTSAYTEGKAIATFGYPHVSLIESDMSIVYDPVASQAG